MRMAIACTKSVGAVALIVLWGVHFCFSEQGFLSLDCGGRGNYTDPITGITWIADDNYIQGGRSVDLDYPSLEPGCHYCQTLRVFPKPLKKSCYRLPITPNLPFLLRLFFVGGNYNDQTPKFQYSIETEDMLNLRNVTPQGKPPVRSENILVSHGEVLYICLIRTTEDVDPFVSSIELRPLRQGMYNPVSPGLILHSAYRVNLEANLSVRYPEDPFDRIWDAMHISTEEYQHVTSFEPISTNNTQDHPPPVIMQSAVALANPNGYIQVNSPVLEQALLLLYIADIRNSSEPIFLQISIDKNIALSNIPVVRNLSAIELSVLSNTPFSFFTLGTNPPSKSGPILNGFELYESFVTSSRTFLPDVQALGTVKARFNLSNWISDPCFTVGWDGIQCNTSSSIVRVLEISLSGRNLTGSIPPILGNMTALTNILLDNNHLTGRIPNLSNLVKLKRLHLQNNSLSGNVPDWLAQLYNLKELFIGNNDFSGRIPQKLLEATLLNLKYEGNHYLCMKKWECRLSSHPDERKGKTVGVIVGAIAIVSLLLLLGIIIYRKKLRRKEIVNSGTKGSTSANRESISVRAQDYSFISVPSTPKSRSFSLDEMLTATKNFSNKIGQGGFGSVFLGEFDEGKQIAVKVLSFFSKQGVAQFLNEIELLSRAHHRNLVCLLGYCNASRDLMLVYEYMSGSSLNDHLYGRNASNYPKLDWKTRLKIALDAAQGLEYLHTKCTPKIIHRDIKTANILLDANLTGKLADFGLSRVATDDVSHVTTAVRGTAGYVDPKYFTTHMLTEKSDVYSFGVVLLEIICGRRPIDITLSEPQVDLVKWVTPYMVVDEDAVNIIEIVDKSLGNSYDKESITRVAKLAMRCIESEPSHRPSVSDVVTGIKDAMKYEI